MPNQVGMRLGHGQGALDLHLGMTGIQRESRGLMKAGHSIHHNCRERFTGHQWISSQIL